MQIVIDMPEEKYDVIKSDLYNTFPVEMKEWGLEAIRKGTPLPKGHGRLIDANYLRNVILLHNFHGNNKYIVPYSDRRGYRLRQREVEEGIINVPTIIEADGGDTE